MDWLKMIESKQKVYTEYQGVEGYTRARRAAR
jgi:hypothetical protein